MPTEKNWDKSDVLFCMKPNFRRRPVFPQNKTTMQDLLIVRKVVWNLLIVLKLKKKREILCKIYNCSAERSRIKMLKKGSRGFRCFEGKQMTSRIYRKVHWSEVSKNRRRGGGLILEEGCEKGYKRELEKERVLILRPSSIKRITRLMLFNIKRIRLTFQLVAILERGLIINNMIIFLRGLTKELCICCNRF